MTPAPLGAFVLVLHAHLPWVIGHGRWPHGESWLFEAASDAWLPQLAVLDRLAADGIAANWTVGITPVLLEQLACDRVPGSEQVEPLSSRSRPDKDPEHRP